MLRAPSSDLWSRLAFAAGAAFLAGVMLVALPVPALALGEDDDDRRERVEREAGGSHRERYDALLPVPMLESRGMVHAGQQVTIRWRAMRAVEECELLLSIDGGRTFGIRISPEIEGLEDSYVWRVPNVNAYHARIRMRARVDDFEVEGPVGEEFVIVADPERPREAWLFREDGELDDFEPKMPRGSVSQSGRAEIHPAHRGGAVLRPADPEARQSPAVTVIRWNSGGECESRAATPTNDSSCSRFAPLRE